MKRFIIAALLCLGLLPSSVQAADAPIEVKAALQLDQVTDVNQKAENFSIVGTFIMSWKDGAFAFDTADDESAVRRDIHMAGSHMVLF